MEEIWKDVKGYEGLYKVSNSGRLKSLKRFVKNKYGFRVVKEKIKSTSIHLGYKTVGLHKNGKIKTHRIHCLVAESFLGKIKNLVVNHKDGNKLNNNLENLQLVTQKENMKHAFKIGLIPVIGSQNHNSKIDEKTAYDIKFNSKGITQNKLSKKYSLSVRTIRNIQKGVTWKHIKAV